jgi:hypothetical protein
VRSPTITPSLRLQSHLVVYRAGRVLLWAHDAGSANVALASSLDEQTIERFREALGDALRPKK